MEEGGVGGNVCGGRGGGKSVHVGNEVEEEDGGRMCVCVCREVEGRVCM